MCAAPANFGGASDVTSGLPVATPCPTGLRQVFIISYEQVLGVRSGKEHKEVDKHFPYEGGRPQKIDRNERREQSQAVSP